MKTAFRILVVLMVLMAGCVHTGRVAFGQTGSIAMGVPQFFDNNGNPLNGGKLYSYAVGSSTQQLLYTDKELTIAYNDPITLNAAGRPAGVVYMLALPYKLELYTSAGVLVWTADYQYPTSTIGGGWSYNATVVHPLVITTDVLIGGTTDADVVSSPSGSDFHVIGNTIKVFSDSGANSNELDIRATGGAITFESLLNGTAAQIPMYWNSGANHSMQLLASALALGTSTQDGSLTITSASSSSTYTSQGVTANTVATTSLTSTNAYFGTATSPTPIDSAIPLYVKRASGNFAVFNDTSGSTGSLVFVTSSTSSTYTSTTTSASIVLHTNATASSALMTMGIYTAAAMGTGSPGFIITDASNGFIFQVDSTNNAATTGLLVWHNGALQRVGLGAADSGGAGFRLMRVLN